MIYGYSESRVETKHYNPRKNSNKFNILHSMTVHPDGWAKNAKGEKIRAFKSVAEVIEFMQENPYKVSADVLILPGGSRIRFYVPGVSDQDLSTNHAGKSEYMGESYLNSKSKGIEIIRLADRELQYDDDQYKSTAEWIYENNQVRFIDQIATHEMIAPDRKTDPDHFNLQKFYAEYRAYTILSQEAEIKEDLDTPQI